MAWHEAAAAVAKAAAAVAWLWHKAAATVAQGCGGGGMSLRRLWHEPTAAVASESTTLLCRPCPPKTLPPKVIGVGGKRVKAEGGCMWSMHIEVPRHSAHPKSLLLRGEWPLQNPRVFTSRERSFGPPCLDAFHLWSMGG